MNDFMKEELEFIYRSLKQLKWHKSSDIMNKIQSMIDNYKEPCKHPSTNFDEGVYYCDECGYCVP